MSGGQSGPRKGAGDHIGGLDWLRAAGSLAVVMWHMYVFGRSPLFLRQTFAEHRFELSDFLNFHILLSAVPLFIALSCFLFVRRPPSWSQLRARCGRIGILLLFWPFALRLYLGNYQDLLRSLPGSFAEAWAYLVTGAHTIYYFFASLLIITAISFAASRLSSAVVTFFVVLSGALVASLPLFAAATDLWQLTAYWNPLNFVPCAFASVLLARNFDAWRGRAVAVLFGLLAASGVSAFLEWRFYVHPVHFPGQGFALPAYTRLSVLFSAYLFLAGALFFEIPVPRIVGYMSRMSLALYCLHPFTVPLAQRIVRELPLLWLFPAADFVITVGLAYGAAHVLGHFLNRRLLR